MKTTIRTFTKTCGKYLLPLILMFTSVNSSLGQCGMTINTNISNVTCFNGTNGSVTITVTGGTAPYLYQLAESGAGAWYSNNTFASLAAATYPLSVKDNTGCIKTVYFTVTQPTAFVVNYTATDVTCVGGNTGSIATTTTGGTAPYNYAWKKNGTAYATTANINSLSSGNYTLIVTDANGCTVAPNVAEQIKSIGLTGFNEDVVANGNNASPASKTSQAFDDNNGSVLYENGYTNASNVAETPGGLPTGGNFASLQSASRLYQLAPYSSSNSLLLRSSSANSNGGSTSGTLSFQSQYRGTYHTLYVLGSTGSGTGTVNYTINFSDATTATGSLTFADWYLVGGSSQTAIKLKRIARSTGVYDSRYEFNLFELPITISAANQAKTINSIGFTWVNAGSARVNIMAITGYTATSTGIHINDGTTSNVSPAVSIISNAASNSFCIGQSVIFTASPVNGGNTPSYQWKKNGSNTGTNSPTYTSSSLNNNDIISVVMTSNLPCVNTPTANSNTLTMINGTVNADVNITASATNICSGNTVNFTATPSNGGSSPSYQWKLNNVNVGSNSPTYSNSALSNNDQVKVIMTSSVGCATPNPATSNTQTILTSPVLTPDINVIANPVVPIQAFPVTFTAFAVNGGPTPGYQWYKNGSPVSGAISNIFIVLFPTLSDVYSCKLTSSYPCSTTPVAMSNYVTVTTILPVTLDWYNARPENGKALLQWKTSLEASNKQFIIERASNTSSTLYTTAGYVSATNLPNGSSYSFVNDPGQKGIFLYRLTQEDIDGHKKILGIRSVNLKGNNSWLLQDLGSYWQLSSTLEFNYRLIDMQGRTLRMFKGNGTVSIDKPQVSGIYILQIETGGELFTQKLLK